MDGKLNETVCAKKRKHRVSRRVSMVCWLLGLCLSLYANEGQNARPILSNNHLRAEERAVANYATGIRQTDKDSRVLTGVVTDKLTGEPLTGVTIQVKNRS